MASERFRYDRFVDEALRGVVRRVLADVAANGLTGNHHFYISFHTTHPGVEMPGYLRSRYPDEITIVLQHQFWGLEVTEDCFMVTVSFNKQNERLSVPFAALTAFVDPSVRFGLQFEEGREDGAQQGGATAKAPLATVPGGAAAPAARDEGARPPADKPEKKDGEEADRPAEGGSGKVVTLDAFRKK